MRKGTRCRPSPQSGSSMMALRSIVSPLGISNWVACVMSAVWCVCARLSFSSWFFFFLSACPCQRVSVEADKEGAGWREGGKGKVTVGGLLYDAWRTLAPAAHNPPPSALVLFLFF